MKDDIDIAELLQQRARELKFDPLALADLIDRHADGLSLSKLIAFFKRAFPSIPLHVLIESGRWHRLSGGDMTDEEFREHLHPWFDAIAKGDSNRDGR